MIVGNLPCQLAQQGGSPLIQPLDCFARLVLDDLEPIVAQWASARYQLRSNIDRSHSQPSLIILICGDENVLYSHAHRIPSIL